VIKDAVYLEASQEPVQEGEVDKTVQESEIDKSMLVARSVADQVLITRYQCNQLHDVEVRRGAEVVFQGKTDGQVPEIDKLSEAEYDLLENLAILPTAAESQSAGAEWSVRINNELVFVIEEYEVKVNEALTEQQLKALEAFDEKLMTQGEEKTNRIIFYEDEEYTIQYSDIQGLTVSAFDNREVVNSSQGFIAILQEDYLRLESVESSRSSQLEL
jgi:hypothetical protein